MDKQTIINKLESFVGNNFYKYYYVGITNDVDRRLEEHGATYKTHVSYTANSKEDAENVEEYFLSRGCDGDVGGGDNSTTIVYMYKK